MRDIYRYGAQLNSHDLLKILAITTMVVDHVGRYLLANNVWFRVVGRMAAPQFFFMVGYSGSYRFKRDILLYGLGLVIVNYLTSTSPTLLFQIIPLNVLVAFVLVKALLNVYDPLKLRTEYLVLLLAGLMLVSLPTYIVVEYGTLGLCYAIGARLLRNQAPLRRFWISATVFVHFFFEMTFLLFSDAEPSMSVIPYAIPLMAAVFLANLAIFMNYRFRTFELRQRHLRTLAIYVSRYSLQIYFFHLSIFMIIAYA